MSQNTVDCENYHVTNLIWAISLTSEKVQKGFYHHKCQRHSRLSHCADCLSLAKRKISEQNEKEGILHLLALSGSSVSTMFSSGWKRKSSMYTPKRSYNHFQSFELTDSFCFSPGTKQKSTVKYDWEMYSILEMKVSHLILVLHLINKNETIV